GGALAIARKVEDASKTSSDAFILAVADGIVGVCLYWLGEYEQALTYAQRAYVQTAAPTVRQTAIVRAGLDSFLSAGVNLTRIHWAQSRPDRAAQKAQRVVTDAAAGGHPLTLFFAFTWGGCLIPPRRGGLSGAALPRS